MRQLRPRGTGQSRLGLPCSSSTSKGGKKGRAHGGKPPPSLSGWLKNKRSSWSSSSVEFLIKGTYPSVGSVYNLQLGGENLFARLVPLASYSYALHLRPVSSMLSVISSG